MCWPFKISISKLLNDFTTLKIILKWLFSILNWNSKVKFEIKGLIARLISNKSFDQPTQKPKDLSKVNRDSYGSIKFPIFHRNNFWLDDFLRVDPMLRLPQGKAILAGINLQLLINSQNQEIYCQTDKEWYDQIRWIMKRSLSTIIEENHYPFFLRNCFFCKEYRFKQATTWMNIT